MNTEQNEEKHVKETAFLAGAVLKQARKKMGLSKQDVADRLKLRLSVIRELEDNSCAEKQVATFTRGYIRSYSKFLGLDPDDIMSRYKSAAPEDECEQKMQSFSRKTIRDKDDSRVMGLTWLIFFVAFSLTLFWWWQNQQAQSLQQISKGNNVEDLALDAPLRSRSFEETDIDKMVDNNESEILILSTDANVDVTAGASGEADKLSNALIAKVDVPKVEVALIPKASLVMSFSGDCWVEVYDSSGQSILMAMKATGDQLTLSGQAPFRLVLGAPSVVNLTFDGKNIDLSGYSSGRVARLSLPK